MLYNIINRGFFFYLSNYKIMSFANKNVILKGGKQPPKKSPAEQVQAILGIKYSLQEIQVALALSIEHS